MATFKDNKGREWVIQLDAPTITLVRQEFDGFDLANLDGSVYLKLTEDVVFLVDVLWVLVRDQAQALSPSVSDVDFGRALGGDSIDNAVNALLEAISNFIPQRKRVLLTAAVREQEKLHEETTERVLARIRDPETKRQALEILEARMAQSIHAMMTRYDFATATPDSSASTPADSGCANSK
jgi:hypothetical protein